LRTTNNSDDSFVTYAKFYKRYGLQSDEKGEYDPMNTVLNKLKGANLDDEWEYRRSLYQFHKK
jgi:hypothetical protein